MLNRRRGNLFLALFLVFIGNFILAQNRGRVEIARKPSAASLRAGAFIDVNAPSYPESGYPITQLINDVLISGGTTCTSSSVSNVTVSPNLPASNQNRSWGYFNKSNTNFPFSKGIILSTGYANKAGNTLQGTLSDDLGTGGDVDLANALGIGNNNLTNATSIEFDFVAASTEITFRYLFASKEYQQNFPCTITDGFALLLKKASDPNYTNLAVLPGGAGAVSVTNIHPQYQNCGPKNEAYYGGTNTAQIETNFNGRTIPLTAKATVIPGETYHFKIVLADYQDPNFDSAVFLEAGSFDIGVKILDPAGVQLPGSVNMCDNTPQTFTASVQGPNITYQWYLGTNPIAGATNASYTATAPGVYTVKVYIQGNTCPGEATITVVGGTSPTVQNATLTACYAAGNATFNLPSAQASISTTPGAVFSYYATLADANAGNTNTIPTPTTYQSAGGTVYVRVANGPCAKVAQLQLVKAPQMTPTIAPPIVLTCANSQTTLDASASVYPTGATFNWTTTGGNIVSGATTLNPVINAAGTYTLTITKVYQPGNISCTAVGNVTVTGNSAPPVTGLTASKIKICKGQSTTLTASGGATYNWGNGLTGNGSTQVVSPTVTTTYTVTAVGANGCVSQNPATITIEVSEPFTAQNATLHKCYQPGLTYNLTEAQPQITTAGGVTFTYYVNQADANAANGNFIATPTTYTPPGGSQTIYVLASNGGCSYVVSLQLLSTAQTTLTIAAPQTITCTTPQITLNASASVVPAGSTIAWTTTGGTIVSGGTTLTPVVSAGGTYTLTVTNVSQPGNLSCTYTSTVTVQEDKVQPVAALVSSVPRICIGESVTLTASGGVTYNWGNGLTGNGSTQVVSPTTTTVYTVFAVGANGCISATPATVTVQVGPPIAGLTASKLKICEGESVTLTATGGITYNWIGLTGNGNTQIVTPTTTTEYSVFALGGNGCSSVNPAKVTIEVVPAIVSTLKDVFACAGDKATLDAGPGPNYTYLWNTGATTQTITTNVAGTYSVIISNGVCSKTFSAQLINPDLPQFTNVVYDNHILTLTASNPTGGTLEYSIDGGLTWQTSNIFTGILNNTMYSLMVRVKGAKCGTSLDYFTFVISNAITPNMDGVNDTIDFTGISGYKDFAASIFDRYGAEVFKAAKGDVIWTGSLKGINLSTGTYWYRVQWENPASKKMEQRSGWILLKNRN
ncbi:T9SS type B sorting domain-containing protein [Chryseobacterium panacisoli]|uniref:T9SS type B sorting domain-containing protein n=1 Tax=Chryseobacterium panacisoli TaxID=1807141 RepID=A0A5D8ZJH0_9FLAO|nr:choice-of-anchor L domain-containing protein [Chryseobacterium panacisoli]TZF95129.1 T9SS type B sorting domain-containing protein [Chryseobacterium panacisoli]